MAFNLIDQPWLPVLDPSGAPAEVSLAEAFADDHRALAAETPTQNAALLRLLLAVAHAALTPTGTDGWDRWWAQGRLPADRIAAYLESHRARFDLLHPTAPFFQVADLSTAGGPRPAAALIPDAGRMMHTTREGTGRDRLDFAAAARWLVHCHAYATAGIKAAAAGDPRAVRGKSFPIGAGSMRGAVYYTEGPTLAETLLLNLVPGGRTPAWGREPDTAAPRDGECHGLADLYTWQTRRVRLHHDGEAVTGALVCQGDRSPDQTDPMGLWRLDATKTWRRRNFDPGRHAGEAGERITQQTAQHIVNAVTDTEADLEAWFATHERVLRFIPAEVNRRRAHQ